MKRLFLVLTVMCFFATGSVMAQEAAKTCTKSAAKTCSKSAAKTCTKGAKSASTMVDGKFVMSDDVQAKLVSDGYEVKSCPMSGSYATKSCAKSGSSSKISMCSASGKMTKTYTCGESGKVVTSEVSANEILAEGEAVEKEVKVEGTAVLPGAKKACCKSKAGKTCSKSAAAKSCTGAKAKTVEQ